MLICIKRTNQQSKLGVTLEHDTDTGFLEMKKIVLIQRLIEAVGLDDGMNCGKYMPTEATPLVNDEDGELAVSDTFSYSSVVGMIFYLSGHTCPDIVYGMNFCA